MSARYILVLVFFVVSYSYGQVGIGTTSPSASLDIQSSNQATPSNTDGLLIPKIDEFPASNPGANQDGMLVYATGNGAPAKGFYYWDNATTTWVNVKGVAVETDPKVGTLATGYVPRWNGTTLEDGAIFNSATNIGIGTLNPQRLFDVRSGTGTATPNWISGTFGPTNNGDRIVLGNLNGNATIGSHNSALNAWADLYLNSGGRVEIPYVLDASSAAGSGSLEIGNALRIDDNEIITNSNSPLYFNNDNNGDVIIDNNSLMVDASTNKVGIGTGTPGAIITNSKLDVVGGHVAVSNNFGVLSFNSANNGIGAGFDTTTADDLHLYAGGANRLIVTNTGNVSAPSFTIAGINATGNKALITKEYADANYIDTTFSGDYNDLTNQPTISNPTGLEAINEGNGIGWRLIGRNPAFFGNIGNNAVDFSVSNSTSLPYGATGISSFAINNFSTASGQYSVALGRSSTASGHDSFASGAFALASGHQSRALGFSSESSGGNSNAIGWYATASGNSSTAIGGSTIASGNSSTVIGINSIASGQFSIALGYTNRAESFSSTAIGFNNIGGGNLTTWVATDPLFEIGNGYGGAASNAMTVLKNGNIGIGIGTPSTKLHIFGANDASLANGSGLLVVGDESSLNIVFDRNEIMARNNGAASPLYLQQNGGAVYVNGAVVHASDRRLKTNIEDLNYGLTEILKLQPKAYHWKNRPQNKKSLGLIAQDVQLVINEIVTEQDSESQTLGVNYTELIPVLINATKEQQNLIEQQQKEIESLRLKLQNFETLSRRIEKIEAQLTPTNQ